MACWAMRGGRDIGSPPERTPGGTTGGSLVALTSREKSGFGGTVGLAGSVRLRGVSELSGRGEEVSLGSPSGRVEVDETGSGILDWLDTFLSRGETSGTSWGAGGESGMSGVSWQIGDFGNNFGFLLLPLCVIFTG